MLAYWTHTLDPFLIKFPDTWPLQGIRWYGFAYFVSFLLAYLLLKRWHRSGKIKLNGEMSQNFLFALFCGILLGGRLGFVLFYQWPYYVQHPLEVFAIWQGGMSAHGAFLGIVVALLLFGKKSHWSFFSLSDLAIPLGTLGIFFGRCANFINGEVYGRLTEVPWGVLFANEYCPRHPSQLYEAMGEGLLLFLWSRRRCFHDVNIVKTPGLLASHFLVAYGILRFALEFFREPDAPLVYIFSRGQFFSLWAVAFGLYFSRYVKKLKISPSTCVFNA